ncbi:MAG: sigma 54-interacting transcriptional regulator [Alkalispirochaetaceae bacterium]
MFKTLIITSDRGVFNAFTVLFDHSMVCFQQETAVLAVDSVRRRHPHLILLDIDSVPVDPRSFIPRMILASRRAPVVVLLRSLLLDLVVEMMRCGAADILLMPPKDPQDAFRRLVRLATTRLMKEHSTARRNHEAFSAMVGESVAMERLQERICRVARSEAAVSIEGETGSGKELVAQAIHKLSSRRAGPFITRNCASIPEQLVEAELFGVARGAYTGAVQRPGSFEEADRGTLFLDEISDLALGAQSKLLRVTEDRQVRRVGESLKRPVSVRLLVASNRSLKQQVAGGSFRRDLLYRLNTLNVPVPPLRERREDIRAIASTYLERMSGGTRVFAESTLRLLETHEWPGNVRELLNVVERARVFSDEAVIPAEAISIDE